MLLFYLKKAPITPCSPCMPNTCSNNGDCFSLSCQAYCVCNPGYTGDNCELPLPGYYFKVF